MKKKVVRTLRQEVKVKADIVTSDDIKIYYTGKFQDFTARYMIKRFNPSIKSIAQADWCRYFLLMVRFSACRRTSLPKIFR